MLKHPVKYIYDTTQLIMQIPTILQAIISCCIITYAYVMVMCHYASTGSNNLLTFFYFRSELLVYSFKKVTFFSFELRY